MEGGGGYIPSNIWQRSGLFNHPQMFWMVNNILIYLYKTSAQIDRFAVKLLISSDSNKILSKISPQMQNLSQLG